VLIPSDNQKDLAEIPKNIKDKVNIVPVKWIDEVFELALQRTPRPSRSEVVVTPERDTSTDEAEQSEAVLPH
jgi:ATP-dependent Lon protease